MNMGYVFPARRTGIVTMLHVSGPDIQTTRLGKDDQASQTRNGIRQAYRWRVICSQVNYQDRIEISWKRANAPLLKYRVEQWRFREIIKFVIGRDCIRSAEESCSSFEEFLNSFECKSTPMSASRLLAAATPRISRAQVQFTPERELASSFSRKTPRQSCIPNSLADIVPSKTSDSKQATTLIASTSSSCEPCSSR